MVTAGVYLLMRTSPLIEYSSTVLILCLWIGAITTIFSSLIGLFQQDVKKVIAYSTMSQLAQEYLLFRHQTICGELVSLLGTLIISYTWYTVKVKILLFYYNPQVTKAYNSLVGTSEAICLLNKNKRFIHKINNNNNDNLKIKQWLAGLIDGDGSFLLSKKGYASLEITIGIRDERALQTIKNIYGGAIKLRSNANALRYRLHHKIGLLALIKDINGLIRNPNRIIQSRKDADPKS